MPKGTSSRRRRTAGHQQPAAPQHLGARRPDRYRLDSRMVAAEREVGEWARDMRHRAQQAGRLIYKKRKKVKKGKGYKLRVAGRGLVTVGRGVAGTAAATVAGTYLTTRWTVQHSKRAAKYAAPHVRRVAGHSARYAHAYGTVYGGAAYEQVTTAAKKANRQAVRTRARNRTRIRKMRTWAANNLDRAHSQAFEKGRERRARVLLASAIHVAPKGRAAVLSRMKPAPKQSQAQRAEEAAIREAQRVLSAADRERRRRERQQRRPPSRGGGHQPKPGSSTRPSTTQPQSSRTNRTTSSARPSRTTSGGTVMAQRNPAAQLEKAFNELADYTPEDYQDWMHLLLGLAKAFRVGAESTTVLATRMDVVEKMDPRSLGDFYFAGEALSAVMELFGNSGKKFWVLYADRMEANSGRGRTMRDESTFFQQ